MTSLHPFLRLLFFIRSHGSSRTRTDEVHSLLQPNIPFVFVFRTQGACPGLISLLSSCQARPLVWFGYFVCAGTGSVSEGVSVYPAGSWKYQEV